LIVGLCIRDRPPLKPLFYGGGQERGLRPGTLPVAHVAALGMAAETAMKNQEKRRKHCRKIKDAALAVFTSLAPRIHGRPEETMDHVLNLAFPGIDSEALIVALKDLVAISNGSACTSSSYTPSHVIKAMGYSDDAANEAIRLSWCHLTPEVDWEAVAGRIVGLR
jgi:cysteine desulfurase